MRDIPECGDDRNKKTTAKKLIAIKTVRKFENSARYTTQNMYKKEEEIIDGHNVNLCVVLIKRR